MGYARVLCLGLIVAHLYHIREFVVYIKVLRRTIVLGPIGHVAPSMGLIQLRCELEGSAVEWQSNV